MHRTRTIATAIALVATTAGGAVALGGSDSTTVATASPSTTTVAERPTERPGERPDSTIDLGPAIDVVSEAVAAARTSPADTPTALALGGEPAGTDTPGAPSPGDQDPQPTPAAAPVHETLPGGGTPPPPSGPSEPIGELDDDGPVPAGFDFVAPPAPQGTPAIGGGPTGLAVAPSCSHQCISRGDAYARGFGALLVVETTVPTEMFISAIADLDGDGEYEDTHFETTPHGTTKHLWALDHLEPGTTYHAMVAATDEHGHTSYAWGHFTTLSQRDVFVEFGDLEIVGGPSGIDHTGWYLGLDGPIKSATPGYQGILLYKDLPRTVGLDFWVTRGWDCELPQFWTAAGQASHGHDDDACLAWNSTSIDIDLDTIPAGTNHWTSTTVQRTLAPAAGDGALPPGYGDPHWFNFSVPVTLHVSYS